MARIGQTPPDRFVDRSLLDGDLTDQVEVQHETPERGFDLGTVAAELLDDDVGALPPEDAGTEAGPVEHVALIAHRMEAGRGPLSVVGTVGQELGPVARAPVGLTGPGAALPVEDVGQDLERPRPCR